MKLECLLEKIQEATQDVARVTSKSSTLPALQGIYLSVKKNKLTLTSTNLEIGLEISIPVKSEDEWDTLVNGDTFSKTIQSLFSNDKKISISLVSDNLEIKTTNSSITLKTLNKEDYPKLPRIEDKNTITIDKNILIEGFKSTVFATATTEIKPEISAVYVYNEPNEIVFVGTDSFRLAEKKIKAKNISDINILIPNKNVLEIIKVCENIDESISISFTNTLLIVQSESVYLTSRLIDGVFPDYRRIIPKEPTIEVKVLKDDLVKLFKVSTLFSDTFNQCSLSVNSEENKLYIKTSNNNLGEVISGAQAVVDGGDIEMNFNYKYIQDTFQILKKESVLFSFTNPQKAVIIRSVGDDSYIYLVMPLNR